MKKLILSSIMACMAFAQAEDEPLAVSATHSHGVIHIKMVNKSQKNITLVKAADYFLKLSVELWSLDRGVRLYQPDNALRIRMQGFVTTDEVVIGQGQEHSLDIPINKLQHASSFNKELAKEIKNDLANDEKIEAFVNIGGTCDGKEFEVKARVANGP